MMSNTTPYKNEFDKCSEFMTRLWLYLDGSLPRDERSAWDAHLQVCDRCAQELAEARETIAVYRKLPNDDIADAAFAAAIRQAVNPPAKNHRVLWKQKLIYWTAPLAAAAALLLFVFSPKQPPSNNLEWQPKKFEYNLAQLDDDIFRVESSEIPMISFGDENFSEAVFDTDLQSIEAQIDALTDEVSTNL